ncbi:MAG: hypothetical protein ACI87E_000013 [Mariniblastus sp.]|jgi:hypothetical protein
MLTQLIATRPNLFVRWCIPFFTTATLVVLACLIGCRSEKPASSRTKAPRQNAAPIKQVDVSPADSKVESVTAADAPVKSDTPGRVVLKRLASKSVGPKQAFTSISPKESGIDCVCRLDIQHSMKRLYHGGFACGGVSIGDIDGDGRPDIFLVNGPDQNRLFRQTASFKFQDITESAGLGGGEDWGASAALIDIDNDQDLDIYICNYDTANALYINDGTGKFSECAKAFGLDLVDASLSPAFCDYDRDGDLDLYLLTNRYYRSGGRPLKPPFELRDGKPTVLSEFQKFYALVDHGNRQFTVETTGRSDRVFRNDGAGKFTDVSADVGITQPGHGLSATWWDCNQDGWPDLYVANDFDDPDHLYLNNRDGTFSDVLESAFPHTSWFSMGADFGDLNNDALFDFFVADMSATTHYKQKTTMGAMNAKRLAHVAGPPPQIMKNSCFLNSGTDRFYEAAEMMGIADSDWSWAVKIADFDNDTRNDLFISNGISRNFNNSDKATKAQDLVGKTNWELYEDDPSHPEKNLVFQNRGDLMFENNSSNWGLDEVSMSYSCAYGDLDRDGDLDLIVVNLDKPPSLYRNDLDSGNSLLVTLRGTQSNAIGIGALVELETESGKQIRMLSPQTGFLSGNEPVIHFGLGDAEIVKKVTVRWPSGETQSASNVMANQNIEMHEPNSGSVTNSSLDLAIAKTRQFQPLALPRAAKHSELPFDDFAAQPLLPNKLSQLGPGIAVSDYDGDGDEDFFVSGAAMTAGQLMVNDGSGNFQPRQLPAFAADRYCEDMGAVWFDVDSDDDLDLYVVSGGVESLSKHYRDRLYLNDGQGNLSAAPDGSVPALTESGSCVCAADFDRDGDLDLFVGSRVTPNQYPTAPPSRILENQNGKLVDATQSLATDLLAAGMVTGALWSDANNDGWVDLLVTTEWGPVRYFENQAGKKLVEKTHDAGLSLRTGWWNGISGRDLDGDGDMDYVVTNFGLNTKYHASSKNPVMIYYGDFDGSGAKRLIEAEYENSTLFPIRGKSCSSNAMPHLKDKFDSYHKFGLSSLNEIYSNKCLEESDEFAANTLQSCALINNGAGQFELRPLPRLAQISPSFGSQLTEINGDGIADLILAQNFFSAQAETGRMDGGMSAVLLGTGDGSFESMSPTDSGIVVSGAAMSVALLQPVDSSGDGVIFGVNDGDVVGYLNQSGAPPRSENSNGRLRVILKGSTGNPNAVGARITVTTNAKSQTAEIHAGGGYLTQSSPQTVFGLGNSTEGFVNVRWPDGTENTVSFNDQSIITVNIKGD